MPRIPSYDSDPGLFRPAMGDIGQAGAAGQALARGAAALSDQFAELAAAQQKARDAAALADLGVKSAADLKTAEFELDKDSDHASKPQRFEQQAAAIRDRYLQEAPNSRVQAGFKADYDRLAASLLHNVKRGAFKAEIQAGIAQLDANIPSHARMVVEARNPVERGNHLDRAYSEIDRKAQAGYLTPAQAAQREHALDSNIAEFEARREIAADPQAALDRLTDATNFGALSEDSRGRLTLEATRALQAKVARQAGETAAAKRDLLTRIPTYVETLRDGGLPDEHFSRDTVIATLGEDAGRQRWAEIEAARAFGDQVASIRGATPGEIAEKISALETDPSQPKAAGLLALAASHHTRQLHAKPADYVLANLHIAELHAALTQTQAQPAVPLALAAAMRMGGGASATPPAAENRRAAAGAYANATLAEQERLGVPEAGRQVLTGAMAQDIVNQLITGDPAQADKSLRELAAEWGEAWPPVLADLKRAGLPAAQAELAAIDNPVARHTFAKALALQSAEPGAPRAQAGADAEAIDEHIARYSQTPEGAWLTGDNIKLVTLQAYGHAPFTEPDEAVRRAVGDFGGEMIFTAGTARTSEADDIANVWRDKGASQRDRWRGNVKALPPRNPVPMYYSDGSPVMGIDRWGNTVQVQAPEGVNFQVFAEMGAIDKNVGDRAIFDRLQNFVHSGPWDLQRPATETRNGVPLKTTFDGRYINAATVAIGIYAAAAGWSLHDILKWMNRYAAVFSDFGNVKFSQTYNSLPERNVLNTTIGYNMQKDGKIPKPE